MCPPEIAPLLFLAASLAAAPPSPPLHSVRVPPALAKVTSVPEFSGLAWCAALDRYLVVSDDTGRKEEQSNHTPIVLGMTSAGVLDADPIPITGVASINDPESICAGPQDSYFLVTSHSPNRKGRTPKARRQLLHLKVDKRSLAVIGNIDLSALEGKTSLQQAAGLPTDSPLDIEAIVFDNGNLFIGLKSPLGTQGAAVILRLTDPVRAMREGRIRRDAITRWKEIPLCLDVDGKKVCQGFSDLTFLPDGSLVASANAPKGGVPDGGGAIWWLRHPVGEQAPVLLHRFAGLKPEGVTLSPNQRFLMVVFDGHGGTPMRTELPLPTAAPQQQTPSAAKPRPIPPIPR